MCNRRTSRFRIGHAHTRERQVRTKSPRLARKVLCHTLIFKPRLQMRQTSMIISNVEPQDTRLCGAWREIS
jgi:hypothetical protein